MRRLFAKNLLFVVGVNLLVKPIWIFAIDRTVQNRVGHEAYGSYGALLSLSIILFTVLDFGINAYNTQLISQHPYRLSKLFPVMLSARVLLAFVYAVLLFLIGLLLGFRGYEIFVLIGLALMQILSMMLQFVRSNVGALQHFMWDSVLSVLDKLVMIVVCGILLYKSGLPAVTIPVFVGLQCLGYFLALTIGVVILKRISAVRYHFSFQVAAIWRIIKRSFPYALLILLMALYMRQDVLLTERIAGREAAGIYAAGFRLLDACNMFSVMFAGLLLPLFGRMIAQKLSVAPVVKLAVSVLLPAGFILAVASVAFSNQIMNLLYKETPPQQAAACALLMCTFPAYCILYIYSTLLTSGGHIRFLNKISAGAVALSLILNLTLIPRYGSLGAAISAFSVMWLLGAGLISGCHRKFALPHHVAWIARLIAFPVLIAIVAFFALKVPVSWFAQASLFLGGSGILYLAFGFVKPEDFKLLLKK